MESPPLHPLLEVSTDEMKKVRLYLNIDVVRMRKNLDAITVWAEKEEHLAEALRYLDINYLERLYIMEEGSVEGTKRRIDRLLTTRRMLPEISLHKSIDEFDEFLDQVIYLPLPKLNPADLTRVTLIQLSSKKGFSTNVLTYMRYMFLVIDYCMRFEYSLGERFLLDFKRFNPNTFSQNDPFVLRKAEVLCTNGYGLKIKGIHIVNPPLIVGKLTTKLKNTFSEKVFGKIHIHNNIKELHKHIPKEVLTEEYGGDLESASTLYDKWKCIFKSDEARKLTEKANKLVADESKRSPYIFNEEYLGLPGSLHQLIVD